MLRNARNAVEPDTTGPQSEATGASRIITTTVQNAIRGVLRNAVRTMTDKEIISPQVVENTMAEALADLQAQSQRLGDDDMAYRVENAVEEVIEETGTSVEELSRNSELAEEVVANAILIALENAESDEPIPESTLPPKKRSSISRIATLAIAQFQREVGKAVNMVSPVIKEIRALSPALLRTTTPTKLYRDSPDIRSGSSKSLSSGKSSVSMRDAPVSSSQRDEDVSERELFGSPSTPRRSSSVSRRSSPASMPASIAEEEAERIDEEEAELRSLNEFVGEEWTRGYTPVPEPRIYAPDENLPAGWMYMRGQNRKTFWYNKYTAEISSDRPKDATKKLDPVDFYEITSNKEGNPFYYNVASGSSFYPDQMRPTRKGKLSSQPDKQAYKESVMRREYEVREGLERKLKQTQEFQERIDKAQKEKDEQRELFKKFKIGDYVQFKNPDPSSRGETIRGEITKQRKNGSFDLQSKDGKLVENVWPAYLEADTRSNRPSPISASSRSSVSSEEFDEWAERGIEYTPDELQQVLDFGIAVEQDGAIAEDVQRFLEADDLISLYYRDFLKNDKVYNLATRKQTQIMDERAYDAFVFGEHYDTNGKRLPQYVMKSMFLQPELFIVVLQQSATDETGRITRREDAQRVLRHATRLRKAKTMIGRE